MPERRMGSAGEKRDNCHQTPIRSAFLSVEVNTFLRVNEAMGAGSSTKRQVQPQDTAPAVSGSWEAEARGHRVECTGTRCSHCTGRGKSSASPPALAI